MLLPPASLGVAAGHEGGGKAWAEASPFDQGRHAPGEGDHRTGLPAEVVPEGSATTPKWSLPHAPPIGSSKASSQEEISSAGPDDVHVTNDLTEAGGRAGYGRPGPGPSVWVPVACRTEDPLPVRE